MGLTWESLMDMAVHSPILGAALALTLAVIFVNG